MKKMIVVMALVAASFGASAAQVAWSVNGGQIKTVANSTVNMTAGTTGLYLIYGGSDINALVTALTAGNTIASAGWTVASNMASTQAGGGNGPTYPIVSGLPSVSTTFYTVAFDTTGAYTTGNHFQVSKAVTVTPTLGSADTPPGTDVALQFGAASFSAGTTTGWVTVVPEPTSMALLALGVAALGLRRKFRA